MPDTWIHLTARVAPGAPDLTREDTGEWLWPRLHETFPDALASELMPNHPHVVKASRDPDADAERLARLLGHFGRCFGVGGQVSIVSTRAIEDRQKLHRHIRYVALNPCRERLASCPLAWTWSTHRDVVGASVDPWVTADRLARALQRSTRDFAELHHAYVSADPSAHVAGTPFPQTAVTQAIAKAPLDAVHDAAVAALRFRRDAVRERGPARALFVALAFDQGWTRVSHLAQICGCGDDAIRRYAALDAGASLAAARMCLGDERLRRHHDPA
ncbi:MAG TPA: hypothetical protein VG755_03725, partial [Nannocystaceae bacterium]|nr:hypothetical protein [Nannocystaceae bacterium]